MQQRTFYMLIAVTALVLTIGGWAELQGQQAGKARPCALGVLDLAEVFQTCEESTAMQAEIEGKVEDYQRELLQRRNEIEDLQKTLELLGNETPTRRDTIEQIEIKAMELKVWMQLQQSKLELERTLQNEMMYRRAMNAVNQFQVGCELRAAGVEPEVVFKSDPHTIRHGGGGEGDWQL